MLEFFTKDDWEGWIDFSSKVGEKVQTVGDDLTVTNIKRIERAAKEGACNALLLKVNQIGSVSESIAAVKLAKQSGWGVMTSHRSGETEDNYIADLAVGLCTGQIKTGAPCRSERLSKYNQVRVRVLPLRWTCYDREGADDERGESLGSATHLAVRSNTRYFELPAFLTEWRSMLLLDCTVQPPSIILHPSPPPLPLFGPLSLAIFAPLPLLDPLGC